MRTLRLLFCRFACALGLVAPFTRAQPAPTSEPPLHSTALRVGLPRAAFGDLNENDAKAAYHAFIRSAGHKHGYDLQPDVFIYDTLPDLEQAIRDGVIHLVVLSPWQLVRSGLGDALDVEFMPIVNGAATGRVLLLGHRANPFRALADLRGRTVKVLVNANSTLNLPWLETACLAAGLGTPNRVFGRVDQVGKPNAALLPVFFRQADACLIDEHSFAIACELNPQLKHDLLILEQSEPVLKGVVCLNRTGWESAQYREDLRASLAELHREPAGRQILTLFRIDRLAPFEPESLRTITALVREHDRLVRSHSPTLASPAAP